MSKKERVEPARLIQIKARSGPRIQDHHHNEPIVNATASSLKSAAPALAWHSRRDDFTLARRAITLAIGSLLLAGCFSILLVFGRVPGVAEWIGDPQFFKRCLVLHVDLALVVWFFSFAAGLFALLPGSSKSNARFTGGFIVACGGVVTMIAGTMVPGTAPVLANYVPVIDNSIYVPGVALFFGGLLICFFNDRLVVKARGIFDGAPDSVWSQFHITPEVAAGLKAAAVAYIVAVTTFLISALITPRDLDAKSYYELVFWGGGHVLQVANVATMLSVWLLLVSSLLKRSVIESKTARALFLLLVLPHLAAPALTINGTVSSLYRLGFTRLMQFGIFPVVLIILAACIRSLYRAWLEGSLGRTDLRDSRFIGFAASAALTLTGFVVGSAIRNSNTMIPAHYHASIGAVTVGYMTVTYLLLKPLGLAALSERLKRLIPWQLACFGFGQVIFVIGFGFGGFHGLGRKAYSVEQHITSVGALAGIVVMAAGGIIAVAGGILFLFLTVWAGCPRLSTEWPLVKFRTAITHERAL